jgi:hypothetical protein
MSDITKPHKINVDYSCTETGQEASIEIEYTKGEDSYSAKIDTDFDPPISDETLDPMNILGKILNSIA